MELVNDARGIRIFWTCAPCEGKPLTRVWIGPDPETLLVETSVSGDTLEGEKQETAFLLSRPGWRVR